MTLYRKYRPQKLSELDNSLVRDRLIRVFSSPFIPHALLFAGPKGTGKTSAARIVAKVLNCELRIKNKESRKESEIEPCNKCEACISITQGRNVDVFEIDAASNRGIDEIRELRERIKLAPVSAKYKVYIIDEVHMLTTEAFNALLKTLEEPPPHAVFILATTEADKLPPTITSRCINFVFKKATDEEIASCLKRVLAGEKMDVPAGFLELVSKVSDGSFRDATKIIEQAIAENALTETKLISLLGRQYQGANEFLKLLVTKDTGKILANLNDMVSQGVNLRFVIEDTLTLLHKILLAQHEVETDKINNDLIKLLDTKEILNLIKLFSRVFVELKNTAIPQLPLEVAVVEWCGQN